MSSFGVSEFDAAQALLDLQSNVRDNSQNAGQPNAETVESAKLFPNLLASNSAQTDPPSPKIATAVSRIGTVNPIFVIPNTDATEPTEEPTPSTSTQKRKSPDQELPRHPRAIVNQEEQKSKRSKLFKRKPVKYTAPSNTKPITIKTNVKPTVKNSLKKVNNQAKASNSKQETKSSSVPSPNLRSKSTKTKVETREIGTQTDNFPSLLDIENTETTFNKLCEKIRKLEEEIHANSQLLESIKQDTSDNEDDDESNKPNSAPINESNATVTHDTPTSSRTKNKSGPNRIGVKSTRVLGNRNMNNIDADEMIPIGYNRTMIPARIFRHINWNSYTAATRKLLTAVFSRRVLATHSLTGKSSPAFPKKPAKIMLNSTIVNDIVQTVVERCHVPENVVRTSITTKCADESKMFRTRQENKKKRKVNRENIPPDSESD